jgi:hypothetical protein
LVRLLFLFTYLKHFIPALSDELIMDGRAVESRRGKAEARRRVLYIGEMACILDT